MIGLDSIASERLCLTLLHSLWQVALLALAAWGIGRCLGRRHENASYVVHAAALAMGLIAAPITHAFLSYGGPTPLAELASMPVAVQTVSVDLRPNVSPLPPDFDAAAEAESPSLPAASAAQTAPIINPVPAFAWQSIMPWLAGAYLLGVVLMLARLAWSAFLLERLRATAQPVVDGPVFRALARICSQWSIKSAPILAHAERVVVPKVVGLLKPTILLPSTALTGLPIGDLELILAHELAHIRRHDLWINLLQRLAEAILFFNPAMWWLSRRVSTLREYCCDDRACAVIPEGGKPQLRYAEALLHAVELQHTGSSEQVAALAATGRSPSELRRRVARLFGEQIGESIRLSRSGVAVLLAGAALLLVAPTVSDSSGANEPESEVSSETSDATAENQQEIDADRIVAEARRRTFGLQEVPKMLIRTTRRGGEVTSMPAVETEGLDQFWKVRGQTLKGFRAIKNIVAWDKERLLIEDRYPQNGQAGKETAQTRYWDGREGWIGEDFNSPKSVYRYSTIEKLTEYLEPGRFPRWHAAGGRLPWPGLAVVLRKNETSPELTRYSLVGEDTIDGVACDIFEGPARMEKIWIEKESGLVKAVSQHFTRNAAWDLGSKELQEITGRAFADAGEYRQWFDAQTEETKSELRVYWAEENWENAEPSSLSVFSKYEEIAAGVRWPMRCERIAGHAVGAKRDRFKFYLHEIVTSGVEREFKIKDLAANALPAPGVKVTDRTAKVTIDYEWSAELNEVEVERLREKRLAEVRAKKKEEERINATPINSVDDAIQILTEGPKTDPTKVWARAIKYLADHPEPALPALIETLDSEDRDHPISKLAFALRALGDARAVPALIRVLPRTLQPSRSDYGLRLDDHELCRFMQQHDGNGKLRPGSNSFDYGRAFREVVFSLRRLTGKQFNEMDLNWIRLKGTEQQRRLARQQFDRVAETWAAWWESEWEQYVQDPAYSKVGLAKGLKPGQRPVEARKPPSGPGVELLGAGSGGIIQSVHDTGHACFIDLDTKRQAGWPNELPQIGKTRLDSPELLAWARREGYDIVGITHTPVGEKEPLFCLMPIDLRAWKITEGEHRGLQDAIRGKKPYPLTRPVDLLIPRRTISKPRDPKHSGDSFLFVTREGTAGVLRLTAQVTAAKNVTGYVSSDDDLFEDIGFYRGVKYVLKTMSVPAVAEESSVSKTKSVGQFDRAKKSASTTEHTHLVSVFGRTVDRNSNPIEGAKVYLVSQDPGHRRIAETLSEENGRYRFDNVLLPIKRANTNQGRDYGVFEVFAIADGHALGWQSPNLVYPGPRGLPQFASSDPEPPSLFRGDQPIELKDITLGVPKGFQGRIVDHLGNPVVGASVAIRYCDTQWNTSRYNIIGYEGSLTSLNGRDIVPAELKSRTTDEQGRFAFDRLPADYRWEVKLRAKGYPQRDIWVVTNDKGPEVSKSKDGGTIYRGNAEVTLDETREVMFRVLYGDTGKPADRVGVAGRGFLVTTDEQGLAKTRLPRKEHPISLVPRYKSSYLHTRQQLNLSGEEDGEPFTYRIDPAAIVDITVVDENTGEPLAGVDVWWDEPLEGRESDTHRQVRGYRSWEVETRVSHFERLRTDEDGKVRVLFPDGKFRIGVGFDAYPEGYQSGKNRGQLILCKPGEPTSAVFKLEPLVMKPKPTSTGTETEDERTLHVSFVGPDSKPAGGVGVELRGLSDFDPSHVKIGEFVEKRLYGVSIRADASGQLMLDLGKKPLRNFGLHIKEPGYGPYWANWDSTDHPEPIPSEFTVQLERGWSVGGIVFDEAGQPVTGAKVRPSIEYKKRPGDTRQMGAGASVTTAADGSWRFDSVPESYQDVSVEITHPDQSNLIASLARGSYAVAPEGKPSEPLVMPSGLVVAGCVTDSSGQPIVGAIVRTKFHNDVRKATTNDEGRYQLVGCKPKMARIVVSAPGKAMELAEVRVDPRMESVDFVMQPGGKIRIKVVDENGVGIPKARIFFQSWRGRIDYFEFDHVNQYANDQGVWEWSEAPIDEFEADICRPGGMRLTYQKLQARAEEYLFSPPPKLAVSGKVVDAETGAPIEKFRVVRGLRNKNARIGVDWIEYDAYDATDGAYRVTFDRVPVAAMVRVEAIGYRVKTSRDIQPNEGKVAHDFELERQSAIASTILTPDGKPATEAKIALGVAGSQISIKNGDIGDNQTYAQRLNSDVEGRFELPSRDDAFQLVITHDKGFAHLKSVDGPIPAQIKLTPWARVEGVFRVGAKPAPGVWLDLYGDAIGSHGPDVPNIFTTYNATTGPKGRYAFDRVFPGKGRIGRRIVFMVNEGAKEVTSSSRIAAEFLAGKTTQLDMGSSGRPVIGKLSPPEGYREQVLWNFATVTLEMDLPQPEFPDIPEANANDREKRAEWWKAWKRSPEGQAWSAAYKNWEAAKRVAPYLTASVDRDGSFRFDDTPSGDYVLKVGYDERVPGTVDRRLSVKASQNDDSPVDLGTLRLVARDPS